MVITGILPLTIGFHLMSWLMSWARKHLLLWGLYVRTNMKYPHQCYQVDQRYLLVFFINQTKCCNVLDTLCHDKTTKRTNRRWPMRFFYEILDIAAVNSFILYKLNLGIDSFSNEARCTFLKNLAFALTKPLMEKRMNNNHISKNLRAIKC